MGVLRHMRDRLVYAGLQSTVMVRCLWALLVLVMVMLVLIGVAWQTRAQLQAALTQPLPATVRQPPSARQVPLPPAGLGLIETWPSTVDAEHVSADILAQADAMGMVFERAEFQTVASTSERLSVQRIKLPLTGDYMQIRQFLTHILHRYPSLALNQLKLQRSDVTQTQLDAQIEMDLYTRTRSGT